MPIQSQKEHKKLNVTECIQASKAPLFKSQTILEAICLLRLGYENGFTYVNFTRETQHHGCLEAPISHE